MLRFIRRLCSSLSHLLSSQMPEGLTPQEQEFFKKFGRLPKPKGPLIKGGGKVRSPLRLPWPTSPSRSLCLPFVSNSWT